MTRSTAVLWARFRFSVVGSLLSAPPARGELKAAIRTLAEKTWTHPINGREVCFSAVTIERWYYAARQERDDPMAVLRRTVRKDSGKVSLSDALAEQLRQQFQDHQHWSYQLHYDNLVEWTKLDTRRGSLPSYSTVRRYMKAVGWVPKPRVMEEGTAGQRRAARRREAREIRSYEAEYVGSLWHLDFHHASLKVLTPAGQWVRPIALGILDDHSRLCCHLQWYLSETTQDLVHGLSQAIQKRGLPRALLTDNGAAMVAEEVREGLLNLSVVHQTTLPHSPYQNGKQESFWNRLESRLMEMLQGLAELTLDLLNRVTQAWAEIEYNRREHREISSAPVERFARASDVLRASPSSDALRDAFRLEVRRHQRQSDGTISLAGTRFEIPARFRHFREVVVRYARWDLSRVDLVDPRDGVILAALYPLDRSANADGRRPLIKPDANDASCTPPRRQTDLPPLLKRILEEYSATGMPPDYLPQPPDSQQSDAQDSDPQNPDSENEGETS